MTTGTAGFELPRDTRCVPQYSNTFSAVAASTGEGDANNTAHKVAARRAHANDDSDGEPSRAMVLQPNQNESHAVWEARRITIGIGKEICRKTSLLHTGDGYRVRVGVLRECFIFRLHSRSDVQLSPTVIGIS